MIANTLKSTAALLLISIVSLMFLSATVLAQDSDIVEIAVSDGNFTTLVAALQAAELVETLQGEGPFTVFAPTDEAFAKLPATLLEDLLRPENKSVLTSILLYHVASGDVRAADVVELDSVETLNGASAAVVVDDDGVKLDGAIVTATDIVATNGVIHVIDTVILPPDAQFKDVVDTAVAAGSFTTLAAALDAAGLIDTLKGEGPFTVFAPTDVAFAKLPEGTVESLLEEENRDQLISILTYHVVPGKVYSGEVVTLSSAPTVNGQPLPIEVDDSGVLVGNVRVIQTDIMATNGVIHVVDEVIIPETPTSVADNTPEGFAVHGAYPNPFNPTTTIEYSIPSASLVNVSVYDVLGRKITELVNNMQEPGRHSVVWNGTNSAGNTVATGTYLFRITSGAAQATGKVMFLR